MARKTNIEKQIEQESKYMLFMSADITNSTGFKHRTSPSETDYQPWIEFFQEFYDGFSNGFYLCLKSSNILGSEKSTYEDIAEPDFWKCLGDELIFKVEIKNHEHVPYYIESFMRATKEYSEKLTNKDTDLALKATAWTAGFPVKNTEIKQKVKFDKKQVIDEDGKSLNAGSSTFNSNKMFYDLGDYVGPSMDLGFRLSSFSTRRKFIISKSLAIIMLNSQCKSYFSFNFDGISSIKGLGSKKYPMLWLDMKYDDTEEDKLIHKQSADNDSLLAYLTKDNNEMPFIVGDSKFNTIPNWYQDVFKKRLNNNKEPKTNKGDKKEKKVTNFKKDIQQKLSTIKK